MYKESTNILVKHLVNTLRDNNTDASKFRDTIEEISKLMISEALSDFFTILKTISTWQGDLEVKMLDVDNIVFVPILRAGQPMLNGALDILPDAKSGFLAMKRDEQTAQSKLYYENIPNLKDKIVILLDPMVATGGSLIDGIEYLFSKGALKIISLNILGSISGVQTVQQAYPNVDIFIAQIDDILNSDSYIIPGLGDAGDRAFNTN